MKKIYSEIKTSSTNIIINKHVFSNFFGANNWKLNNITNKT